MQLPVAKLKGPRPKRPIRKKALLA
ncbi:uncharacterized protein METZ01_LOCUS469777, partial [marine metagenome]